MSSMMKCTVYVLLAIAAGTTAVSLPPRDLVPRQFGSAKVGAQAPVSTQTLPSKMRPKSKDTLRKRIKYGPFKLRGTNDGVSFGGEKGMNMLMRQDLQPLCQDCIILDGDMWLEFADGTKADTSKGVYNHHMTITATGKPSRLLICPGQFNMPAGNTSPLLGTASDASKQLYTTDDGEFNSGFFHKKGEGAYLSYQLINYKATAQDVYAIAEYEYIPELKQGFLDTTLANLVPNCARLETRLEQNVQSFVSSDYIVPADGYILNTQGHLHNGGDSVELTLNGKVACLSIATYSSSSEGGHSHGGGMGNGGMGSGGMGGMDNQGIKGETLASISKCTAPVAIKKGDKLKVKANFDLDKHPTRTTAGNTKTGVMGFAIVMFAFPPGTSV